MPEHWALPLRARGANLVMDLHPHDRGTRGTFEGAICFNGASYCPSTPRPSSPSSPWPGGEREEIAAHDARSAELARYRFAVISADDADGYPPRHVPGRHGQAPLSAAARLA